ncbi:MAG: PD-(D/E)XK nuclease family protein [Gammaproteobacteria bacterium]|nr:PD-(D/E)XK nuclease family protein [Gammaproteobacteria bacterium]
MKSQLSPETVFQQLQSQQASLITASNRQARFWMQAFHQFASGQVAVWSMPDILPYSGWLDRLFNSVEDTLPVVFNAVEAKWTFESIIRRSSAQDYLISLRATAAKAHEAVTQLNQFALTLDESIMLAEEHQLFHQWHQEYQQRLAQATAIDRAQLADWIRARCATLNLHSARLAKGHTLYLLGFHQVEPSFMQLLEQLAEAFQLSIHLLTPEQTAGLHRFGRLPSQAPTAQLHKALDCQHELYAVANWALGIIAQQPQAKVAIVVPNLEQQRLLVEQIFREVLHPESLNRARPEQPLFNISVGKPLSQFAMFRVAINLLKLLKGSITTDALVELLTSGMPGLLNSALTVEQQSVLRQLAFQLPQRRKQYWSLTALFKLLEPADVLTKTAVVVGLEDTLKTPRARLEDFLAQLPARCPPGQWGQLMTHWLTLWQWPTDESLGSYEFQLRDVILTQLQGLKSYNAVIAPCTLEQALELLESVTAGAVFQPKSQDEPINIMGLYEAVGLGFEYLWVTGMSDEIIPAMPDPNPFIPLAIARQHQLPGSGPERELSYANALLSHLIACSDQINFSYYQQDGERHLSPSALVAAQLASHQVAFTDNWLSLTVPTRIQAQLPAVALQSYLDEQGVELNAGELLGGSQFVNAQAMCPMQAYLAFRLGLVEQEPVQTGIDPRDRGTWLHRALQIIWQELGSQTRLNHFSSEQLHSLVERTLVTVYHPHLPAQNLLRTLEIERAQQTIMALLELERKRAPFQVAATEQKVAITLAGLTLDCRLDRVDTIEIDGATATAVIDYKTGQVASHQWLKERISDPQLPLYLMTAQDSIKALSFVQVNPSEVKFVGVSESEAVFPKVKSLSAQDKTFNNWREFTDHIEQQLLTLMNEIRNGVASVTPLQNPDACRYCPFDAVCRIDELEPFINEDD